MFRTYLNKFRKLQNLLSFKPAIYEKDILVINDKQKRKQKALL